MKIYTIDCHDDNEYSLVCRSINILLIVHIWFCTDTIFKIWMKYGKFNEIIH